MKSLNSFSLIAPCGLNCALCRAYLRSKNKCPGCRADYADKPVTRSRCKIKNCQIRQNGKMKFCISCSCLPCPDLKRLDKRYRSKYNMSVVENLEHIKKFGIKKFVKNEKARWTCSECGDTICVHQAACIGCGKKAERIQALFAENC